MAKDTDPVLKELISIRKLMILSLLKSGMTQNQVATALEIDRTSVSRMFGKGALAGLTKKGVGVTD